MTTKEQVLEFFGKCDELKKCKFIMATTKIKDILKCIVNCPDLYELFATVTKEFNYPLFKSKCLVTVNDGIYNRSYVVMPQTIGHRLAFVFCLFVEFDKDELNFNDFLRKYFPEDGSYFASYHAFCNVVVGGLEEAMTQVFKEELDSPDVAAAPESSGAGSPLLDEINLLISDEKQFITAGGLIPPEEQLGAFEMLTQLYVAVCGGNVNLANALICGYNYFLLYHNCPRETMPALIGKISEYEQTL